MAEAIAGTRIATRDASPQNAGGLALMQRTKKSLTRSAFAAYLCICVAILLLLGVCVWVVVREVRIARSTLLQSEAARLRAKIERLVGRIENDLQRRGVSDLSTLHPDHWRGAGWTGSIAVDHDHRYATIVTLRRQVVMHTNQDLIGQFLEPTWFNQSVPQAGEDVVLTHSPVLGNGQPAYDIRVPIIVNGQAVGDYHAGFTWSWFNQQAARGRNRFWQRGFVAVGGVMLIVLLATTSLFYIAASALGLHKAMSQKELQRASETSQLAAGLAHEIRNPMHAIRLNLHALAKVDGENRLRLSPDEHNRLLTESNREIDRVERLIQELLDFANPDAPRNELVDIASEIQSTLDFIHRELDRQQITVETAFPATPTLVCIDSDRLRQLLLNLLRNAEQALDGPGRIDVSVTPTDRYALVTVANNGPAIPAQDQERIFEPFYSTKKNGSGLGLPLVRRFVNEANGTIDCETNGSRGTVFRIKLPRFTHMPKRNYSS
jgi:signal transduction histidine kinase